MSEPNSAFTELVEQARTGDSASLETLARMVRERLYPYARRVLLDHDNSEDVIQDVLITILQSFGTLKDTHRFWSWAFSIATNNMRERFRREARRRLVSMDEIGEGHMQALAGTGKHEDHLERASRHELAERTQEAMRGLPERQRMVLSLRIYENMAHRQIAEVIGCTELNARVTFFQAKRALLSRLKHMGIHRGALVAALAAFGHLTLAPQAQAATVVVSSTALGEGLVTGLLTAKLKAAVLAGAAVGLGAVMWWASTLAPTTQTAPNRGPAGTGIHFIHQSMLASSDPLNFEHTRSQGAYEQWFQFPQGPDGPFLFRMQRWSPTQDEKLCWWLQNEDANYYIHSGRGIAYITNARLTNGNYSTKVLPTDSLEFCAFIQEVEGERSSALVDQPGLEYERDPASGHAVRRVDRRFASLGAWETRYEYGEQAAHLFQAPDGLPVQDERDEMHKRGWTLFEVVGQIEGRGVAGSGRIPFTYRSSLTHPAWIALKLDGKQVLLDDGKHAALSSGSHGAGYAGGSLFKGLGRPWSGFHTLDVLRRDAARERIWFQMRLIEPDRSADVEIRAERDGARYMVLYRVDLENDLLKSVDFWFASPEGAQRQVGSLTFSYAQTLDDEADTTAPDPKMMTVRQAHEEVSMLWPFRLGEASKPQGRAP